MHEFDGLHIRERGRLQAKLTFCLQNLTQETVLLDRKPVARRKREHEVIGVKEGGLHAASKNKDRLRQNHCRDKSEIDL